MAIGKWHLGHASPADLPIGHGFDAWFGLPYSNDMMPPFVQTTIPLRAYRNATAIDGDVDQDALTERYTTEAIEFIQRAAAKGPFFLYLAHNMPHLPIHASARFRGRSPAGLYGDVIEMLDWSTGESGRCARESRRRGPDDRGLHERQRPLARSARAHAAGRQQRLARRLAGPAAGLEGDDL